MTDCCTYSCTGAHGCPVRETPRIEGPPCPPCNQDCRSGRDCPERRIVKAAAVWFSAAVIAVGCACVILAVQV